MRDDSNYIRTFTGKRFWPLDPRAEDVDIRDIAHALSLKCRYGGHAKRFYSVAEHSVRIARRASPLNKFPGLMHDCGEYVLPDVARPIKPVLPGFLAVETKVERVITDALRIPYPWPPEVHALDFSILTDEMMELLPYDDWINPDGSYRYGVPLGIDGAELGWSPGFAEGAFLSAYEQLRPQ